MAQPTHLRGLQALELAIRKGSLKAAATALSISPAALGQRIKALEDYLGYELLSRSRSGVRPAREVEPALAHLSAAFRELETVTRLMDFQRVDEIHIAAHTDWAQLWLAPRLAAFKQDNPNTLFCINGVGDVPARIGDADCSIGLGVDEQRDDMDMLYRDYVLPIASRENASRIEGLPASERLEGFPLLHLDAYTVEAGDIGWPEWIQRFGHRRTGPERGVRYQWVVQAMEAVYANAGLMLCGLSLVQSQVDEGTLVAPFDVQKGVWAKTSFQARFRPVSAKRAALENFRSWLRAEAQLTRDALERVTKE
ncbi:MAG: LysR family transcriptional regulator [Pseudomonadota bacterium]